MGDMQMGAQARLMSQALRKLTGVVSKSSRTRIAPSTVVHVGRGEAGEKSKDSIITAMGQ